jgi:hypothetical protein
MPRFVLVGLLVVEGNHATKNSEVVWMGTFLKKDWKTISS